MKNKRKLRYALLFLLGSVVASLCIGRYPLKLREISQIIVIKLSGSSMPDILTPSCNVLFSVRLPRVVMSLLVGMTLGISGCILQSTFRNPLVSPDILGVSSGASFGAALAILVFGGTSIAIQGCAFFFGLLAVFLSFVIARRTENETSTVLVLSGIIISSLFSAGLSLLKYVADPAEQLPAIVFWTMGGFSTSNWNSVVKNIAVSMLPLILAFLLRYRLNGLSLGDQEALSIGIDASKLRRVFILASTLMVASSVSFCGVISWIGLLIPHVCRMIVGPDHNVLVPFSAIVGGGFTVLMDALSRSITQGEIPISIITSLIGAPFLIYLLMIKNKPYSK